MKNSRNTNRIKRHRRVRYKIQGDSQRPRLTVHKSLKHLRIQLIDDSKNQTLASFSTLNDKTKGNIESAKKIGEEMAGKISELGIKQIVFDRGGYRYHGQVKVIADAVRDNGIIV